MPEYHEDPTRQYTHELQGAFEFFNKRLFDDELPLCLLSLQRKNKAFGYFSPERYLSEDGETKCHEIAMNPDQFGTRSVEEVLSTLVHEMCHLWQECHGKPGRGNYHNKEWATKMLETGLWPTDDGTKDGKQTGQSMSHLIDEGGPFDLICIAWISLGGGITWRSAPQIRKKTKSGKRVKYACPDCGNAVWGKTGINVMCGDCSVPLEGVEK